MKDLKTALKNYDRETTVGEVLDSLKVDLAQYEGNFYKQYKEDIVFGDSLDVFYVESFKENSLEFNGRRVHFGQYGTWIDNAYSVVFNSSSAEKIKHSEYAKFVVKSNEISELIKKVIRDEK
jgi:hypothetical protein